jgi:hypothetical protein
VIESSIILCYVDPVFSTKFLHNTVLSHQHENKGSLFGTFVISPVKGIKLRTRTYLRKIRKELEREKKVKKLADTEDVQKGCSLDSGRYSDYLGLWLSNLRRVQVW